MKKIKYNPIYIGIMIILTFTLIAGAAYEINFKEPVEKEEKFINIVKDNAMYNMDKNTDKRLYASVVIAQAILESNFGEAELSKEANNLYGLKANEQWKGQTYTSLVTEVVNDELVEKEVVWKKYSNLNESINDYYTYLTENVGNNDRDIFKAETSEEQVNAISKSISSNVDYADLITEIIEQYNLELYDKI